MWEYECTKAVTTSGAFNLPHELDGCADKADALTVEGTQLTPNKEKADVLGQHCGVSDGTVLLDTEQRINAGTEGAVPPDAGGAGN